MRTTTRKRESQRRPRAFVWVALFGLVLFQVAAVSHDSQHAIDDIAESCALCVRLDDTGAPQQAVAAGATVPAPQDVGVVAACRIDDRRPFSSLRTRAPPYA